jgi:hypothetical protein
MADNPDPGEPGKSPPNMMGVGLALGVAVGVALGVALGAAMNAGNRADRSQ